MNLHTLLSLLALPFLLTACSTTPTPTGDRIVSVSWMNQSPVSYQFVQTTICSDETDLTLEQLEPYTEQAMDLDLDLTRNCRVSLSSVVGKQRLPRQSNWITPPRFPSPTREYHLRIEVFPQAPPDLVLEPVETARQRFQAAGRPLPDS
jgi:hypothetical protein